MSSNFIQWNPLQNNQETDAAYLADVLRASGASLDGAFPSITANKLFYQITTLAAALGNALAAKGYAISDANLAQLTLVLGNIVTQSDLAASPVLGGIPKTSTPGTGGGGDNSLQIANTAWVQALFAKLNQPTLIGPLLNSDPAPLDNSKLIPSTEWVNGPGLSLTMPGYVRFQNGFIIQWALGPVDPASSTEPLHSVIWPLAFPNACLIALISTLNQTYADLQDTFYQLLGWDRNQVSYQRQFPTAGGVGQSTQQATLLGIGY